MNDARKADRLRIVLLARYREPTMLDLREAECRDLSLGGMFVATARPSPRGGLIRFECESSAEGESFRGTARVVWQRSKPDPRGPAGMGVRFVHLEPASREALSKLVARVARSPLSLPAAGPMHRAPATETRGTEARATEARATVLPIVELGGPASTGASKRSSLAAPTLRGVAREEEEGSNPYARLEREIRGTGATHDGLNEAPAPRVRTDPPPNLVRNPDRPRSDRPPAAGAVNDEPAWSMPRERTRLDSSGAANARASVGTTGASPSTGEPALDARREPSLDDFGTFESGEPAVKILGNRALNSTAPGLGGPSPSSPPTNDARPAPTSDTRELGSGLGQRDNGGQQSPRSTMPEHAPRGQATDRPVVTAPIVSTAPVVPAGSSYAAQLSAAANAEAARERPSERPQGFERPSQRPAARDRMGERHVRDRVGHARDRMSERPPAPGGIDVLRPQTAANLPAAKVAEQPAAHPVTSDNGAVWQGQRAADEPDPARHSWEPPSSSITPRRTYPQHADDDAVEEAEILGSSGSSIPRLTPPRSPLPESVPAGGRSWGALMLWLVIGSGLVVAIVLSKLFGTAPPGLPDQDPSLAADPQPAQSPDTPRTARYRLVVVTDPPGAKVTVAGTTLVSPAEFGLSDMEKPLLVSATHAGRMSTNVEINKLQFAPRGERFEHELKLTLPLLKPEPARAAPPIASNAQDTLPRAPPRPAPAAQPRATVPASPPIAERAPAQPAPAQPAQAQPFGTPVLPERPRVLPPLGAPLATPGASSPSASTPSTSTPSTSTPSTSTPSTSTPSTRPATAPAVTSAAGSLTVAPSAATGSLGTVTANVPSPAEALKRATDCLLRGDNACVIRELEGNTRNAQELEMLIETYRATRDQRSAERNMMRYVEAYPGARRAAEYGRMLQQRTSPSAATSPAPGTSSAPAGTAPASASPASAAPASNTPTSTTPAAPVPKNPLAPPMPPDPPTR